MVAILFRGEGKWGVQRTLHQFSHHLVCSISAAEAAHMHLDRVSQAGGSALLAYLREQSFFQFGSSHRLVRWLLVQRCFGIPLQRYSAPRLHQGVLSFAWNDHAESSMLDAVFFPFSLLLIAHFLH